MIYLNNRKINEAKIGGKSAKLQEKNVEIVANGTSTITPDNGFDGISTATINVNVPQSGGGNEPYPFSEIGYDGSEMPKMQASINYAKEIQSNWDASQTNLSSKFNNDKKLVYMPMVDTSKVTRMNSMFQYCSSLTSIPALNTSNVTNMYGMFSSCYKLQTIPALNTSLVADMSFMFDECSSLTSIPTLNTSNVTNMSYMFHSCSSLTSILALNTSSVTNMRAMFSDCTKLRFLNIIGLGTQSAITNIDFRGYSYNPNKLIGIDGDGIVGCKQALVDTLLTNSFDRATASYPICKITLAPDTKAVLTAEEISAIEAKGYTIVTE